jgi:hypothetical protein
MKGSVYMSEEKRELLDWAFSKELDTEEYDFTDLSQDLEWFEDFIGRKQLRKLYEEYPGFEDCPLITGVISKQNDGDFEEIWVTDSGKPYWTGAVYDLVYLNGKWWWQK